MPVQTSARIPSFQMRNGPGPPPAARPDNGKEVIIAVELINPPVPDISRHEMTRTRVTAFKLAAAGSKSGSDSLTGHDSWTDRDLEAIVLL